MKQNDLLPLILDSMSDGVLVFDPHRRLVLSNPAFKRLFGDVPHATLLDDWVNHHQFYEPDMVTPYPFADRLAICARSGATIERVEVFVRAPEHDRSYWLQISARPLADGAAAGTLLIFHDISQQKRAELALRANDQYLRTVIANLPIMLCVTDRAGVITLLEGRPLAIFHPNAAAQIGRSLFDVYADAPELEADFRRVLAGESFARTYTFSNMSVEARYAPIIDPQGVQAGMLCVAVDMTERKRAEVALQASEDHLRTVINDLHVGVLIQGPNAEVLLSNHAALELLGLHEDQMMGLVPIDPNWEIVQEDGTPLPRDLQVTPRAIATRRPVRNMVIGGKHLATGERRWMLANAEPRLDRHGNVERVICTFSDITERKEAEAALHESERRFRAIFEQTFQFLGLITPDGTLLEANQTALNFGGVTAADVLGLPLWETRWWSVSCEAQRRLQAAIRDAADATLGRYEFELRGRDDATGIFDVSLKPVRDEHGAVVLLIAEGWDITERKRAEAALRESESTLRSFYDSTTLMMGIVELLEDDDILYISNNASAATFFGMSPGAVDQRRASELRLPRSYRRMWIEHYRQSTQTGRPVTVEYEQPIGERTCWLSATVCPIASSPSDRPRFAYVAEDITERKRSAERISASLREKEVLLQEIHHRVKNNLQVISSLLKLQSASISDERALDMFRESQHRVRSMALVHEKLYQAADLARIDFADYLRSLSTYLLRAYNVGPLLRLHIAAESVLLDVEQAVPLGLIVNELVSNALKYAFPDDTSGSLRIELRALENGDLCLIIGDTGVGLPPGLDLWRTETLGLRLVTMLIRQLQGTIELATGDGTTFTLLIPLSPALP